MTKNSQILVGGAVIFKDQRGRRKWFVVKQTEAGKWEIPKITVRKGESSVRAVLRLTGEMAGLSAKVLEEAGRYTSIMNLNGKSLPQRFYYYLMLHKAGGEALGFSDYEWLEYDKAAKRLELKREKNFLKSAKSVLKEWEKTHKVKLA